MSFMGTGVPLAPLPVRSMYFFKSVLRYSKTCGPDNSESVQQAVRCAKLGREQPGAYQVQDGLAVLFYMLHTQQPADQQEGISVEVPSSKREQKQ